MADFKAYLIMLTRGTGSRYLTPDPGPVKLEDYPLVVKAMERFGGEKVYSYLMDLRRWAEWQDNPIRAAARLVENVDVLRVLAPQPPFPGYLYRGMGHWGGLHEYPSKGQRVTYTTKRPFSSWTAKASQAKRWASSPGIVLKVRGEKLKQQRIFLWPIRNEEILTLASINLRDEFEWAFQIIQPLIVDKWERT